MIFFMSRVAAYLSVTWMVLFWVTLPGNAQTQHTSSLPDDPGIALRDVASNASMEIAPQNENQNNGQSSSSNPQHVAQPALNPNQKTTVVGAPLPPSNGRQQPKRILGVIPNFRAVSAGTKLPPQSVKEKFVTASEDTFDYSALTFAALVATEAY